MKPREQRQALYYFYNALFSGLYKFFFDGLIAIPNNCSPLLEWNKSIQTDDQKYRLFQVVMMAYISKEDREIIWDFIELNYKKSSHSQNINKAIRLVCNEDGTAKTISLDNKSASPSRGNSNSKKPVSHSQSKGKGTPKNNAAVSICNRVQMNRRSKASKSATPARVRAAKRNRDYEGDDATCTNSKKSKSAPCLETTVESKVTSEKIIGKMCEIAASSFLNLPTTSIKSLCLLCAYAEYGDVGEEGSPINLGSMIGSIVSKGTPVRRQLDVDFLCLKLLEKMFGEEVTSCSNNFEGDGDKRFREGRHIHANLYCGKSMTAALKKKGVIFDKIYFDNKLSPTASNSFKTMLLSL